MLNYWIQLTPNVELHLLQLQNPLITASPELQIWREKSLFEASVHQYINIIKSGTQTRLRLNFFVCVSGVAPHVHPCFLFHPFQQKQERFRMKKRITAGKSNAVQQRIRFDFTNDGLYFLLRQFFSCSRIPTLRVVSTGTMMGAAGKINRKPDTFTVNNRFRISS